MYSVDAQHADEASDWLLSPRPRRALPIATTGLRAMALKREASLYWLSRPFRHRVTALVDDMFSYIVAGLAVLLFFHDPLTRYLTAGQEPRRLPRTPRPRINESLLAIDTGNGTTTPLDCTPDAYSVHILSKAPLVVYIEDFLSLDERNHLLEIR